MDPGADITRLIAEWQRGNKAAENALFEALYNRLHTRALHLLCTEPRGQSMGPTALVHEAYLRLIDLDKADWQDRAHFFAVCSQMMRRILVDSARARGSAKRGGGTPRVNLDDVPNLASGRDREIVAIDDALKLLSEMDPRKGRVIELRFFGGLTVEETAEVLKLSPQSVMRDWKLAKAWLIREMSSSPSG